MIFATGAAPITSQERVGVLDVLRGFALLGVLMVHLNTWPAPPFLTTEAQWAALTASRADRWVEFLATWLFYDKANTLFAFLFGAGFWVQMQRMMGRAAVTGVATGTNGSFGPLYLRRLAVLLAIGIINCAFFWPWDILHVYAIAGFALFALRNASDRVLLVGGLVLAFAGRPVLDLVLEGLGTMGPALDMAYSDAAILERQSATSYGDQFGLFQQLTFVEWLSGGLIVGWLAYALGRFMIGAYVARRGWLQRSGELLPQYRFWLAVCLPLGLAGEFVATALSLDTFAALAPLAAMNTALHFASVPLLAVGYVCLIVLVFHSRASGLVRIFAPVGRMALTNYLAQGIAIGLLLYGFAPALDMLGKIGPFALTVCGLGFFAAQILFSHLWLRAFAYGPLEWVWRALTYGARPPMRRTVTRAMTA